MTNDVEARELLAKAYEDAGRHISAVDIRTSNIGGDGIRWFDAKITLAAIRAALQPADPVAGEVADPPMAVLQAGYEAMFVTPWDGTQAPMMGAGYDAMRAALSRFHKQSDGRDLG